MKISSTKFGTKVRCPIGVHLMSENGVKSDNTGEYDKWVKALRIKGFTVFLGIFQKWPEGITSALLFH